MNANKSIAILLSILSALFFAVTFVFNRQISLKGGSWIWSSSLRYFWMVPFLLSVVLLKKQLKHLHLEISKQPLQWILWSTVGFGIFYAPLTIASAYAPSWLVASTYQITIIAGMLFSPLINKNNFKKPLSVKTFALSFIILLGVFLMQLSQAKTVNRMELFFGIVPVLIAAFAYPLGNRKMMQITDGNLTALQRTLGMTLCSLPFWGILSIYGMASQIFPNQDQIFQTLIIALCSGVVATTLFFMATDKVRKDEKSLAAVEASQSAEVVFTLIGEILILNAMLPNTYSFIGIILIIIGMTLHSIKNQ